MKKIIEYNIEDGILFSKIPEKIDVNLEVVKHFISERHNASNGKKQYWCSDISNIRTYNLESRKYADKYGQEFLYACAVIVNSPVSQFIYNVFLKLKSPKIPFKSFYNKEEAVSWLKKIKQENKSVK